MSRDAHIPDHHVPILPIKPVARTHVDVLHRDWLFESVEGCTREFSLIPHQRQVATVYEVFSNQERKPEPCGRLPKLSGVPNRHSLGGPHTEIADDRQCDRLDRPGQRVGWAHDGNALRRALFLECTHLRVQRREALAQGILHPGQEKRVARPVMHTAGWPVQLEQGPRRRPALGEVGEEVIVVGRLVLAVPEHQKALPRPTVAQVSDPVTDHVAAMPDESSRAADVHSWCYARLALAAPTIQPLQSTVCTRRGGAAPRCSWEPLRGAPLQLCRARHDLLASTLLTTR